MKDEKQVARVISTDPASRTEPTLEGFEHRFATVDGVRIHYVIGGKTDGDVVILLAGFPESWFAWRKVMPLLAATYRDRRAGPARPGRLRPAHERIRYPDLGHKDARPVAAPWHRRIFSLLPMTLAPGSPTPTQRCSAARCGA